MRGPIAGFRGHAITAAIAAVLAAAFAVYVFSAGGNSLAGDSYRVRAVLPTSAAIAAQSRVTMAGVDVGSVRGVHREGTGVVVELAIDEEHAPIPVDTRARLRLRTLVGEKSIELTPGRSARTLPDQGTLPLEQNENYVEVDQVLSQLRGRTRERARAALRGLGTAVDGKGRELNELLENASGLVTGGRPMMGALAAERRHITRLVANLGDVSAQIGDRGVALRTLAAQMTGTFDAIAGRDAALRTTLEQLPPTLRQLRTTAGVVRRSTKISAPVVSRLATAITDLRSTPGLLRPAATHGRRAVVELGRAAPGLERTLSALERLSAPAARTVPKIRSVLCDANPLLHHVKDYAPELAAMISGLGSAVNSYDANGHIARLGIGAGPNSMIGGMPGSVARAEDKLMSMGFLGKIRMLGYNPYPEPGRNNGTLVGRGSTGPANAANKFVRVEADC